MCYLSISDSLWEQKVRGHGAPATKPKPTMPHQHMVHGGENNQHPHKYPSGCSTLPKDRHTASPLSSINEHSRLGMHSGPGPGGPEEDPGNPKWVKVMLPINNRKHYGTLGSLAMQNGSHTIGRTHNIGGGPSSMDSTGTSSTFSRGERNQSNDLLSQKRFNTLAEADKRSILIRNPRIAPEGDDKTYLSTFGQTFPLKDLSHRNGSREDVRGRSQDDMDTLFQNGAHSPDDLPPTKQSIV